jgi:hypothetical protein
MKFYKFKGRIINIYPNYAQELGLTFEDEFFFSESLKKTSVLSGDVAFRVSGKIDSDEGEVIVLKIYTTDKEIIEDV